MTTNKWVCTDLTSDHFSQECEVLPQDKIKIKIQYSNGKKVEMSKKMFHITHIPQKYAVKCKQLARTIVSMELRDGDLEWLRDNSFMLDGDYKDLYRKHFRSENVYIVEYIDFCISQEVEAWDS